eukprot:COSAG02_NODE_4848_length_4907_cov_7.395383_2_plen_358_part_00
MTFAYVFGNRLWILLIDRSMTGYLTKTFKERVFNDSNDDDEGENVRAKTEITETRAEKERQRKQLDVIQTGPFTKLAFDRTDTGIERVKMKQGRLRRLRYLSAVTVCVGLMLFLSVLMISLGTWELLRADFDSTGLPWPARFSQSIFFPKPGCEASGLGEFTSYNKIYAALLLSIWTPATCIGTIVLPLWLISLLLGTELASDDVFDLIYELEPRYIKQHFSEQSDIREESVQGNLEKRHRNMVNWQRKVEMPATELVATMECLNAWGLPMGFAIGSCMAFSLGILPTAVAMHSDELMMFLIATATVVPGIILCASAVAKSPACTFPLPQKFVLDGPSCAMLNRSACLSLLQTRRLV